jgi:hypothetical protein
MGLIVLLVILAIPVLLCWLILRKRRGQVDVRDSAPLNPVRLREYTTTGEISFDDPPPGYTSKGPPGD